MFGQPQLHPGERKFCNCNLFTHEALEFLRTRLNVSTRSRSLHLFFQNRDPEVAFLHGNDSKECILV